MLYGQRSLTSLAVGAALVVSVSIGTVVGVSAGPPKKGGAAGKAADSKSLKRLRKALTAHDLKAVDEALGALVQQGRPETLKTLLVLASKMPPSQASIYWSLLKGAVSYVARPALSELGQFVVDRRADPIARDVLYALARNRSLSVAEALCPVLEKGTTTLKLMAAENLGYIRDAAAVDCLIEALKVEEVKSPEKPTLLLETVVESLTRITGKLFGANSVNWEGWWGKNRDKRLRGATQQVESSTITGTAVDLLDRRRREALIGLEEAQPTNVVVLSAEFTKKMKRDFNNDHIEGILASMNVAHTVVRREDFLKFSLANTGALLINCAQFHSMCICPTCIPSGPANNRLYKCTGCKKHVKVHTRLDAGQINKIKRFIQRGGYVFSEDWVVKEFVERAFPKYIEAGEKLREEGGDQGYRRMFEVDVVPVRGQASHPYLKGIFVPSAAEDFEFDIDDEFDGLEEVDEDEGSDDEYEEYEEYEDVGLVDVRYQWSIDDESFALTILDERKVVALLRSGDLQRKVGEDSLVALAFRPGSRLPPGHRPVKRGTPGVVLQVLSHFGKQNARDEHSLQNLLINFLIDAHEARGNRVKARKSKKRAAARS